MFKHLLAPLDGSITAECTLPHLVALARLFQARVTLFACLIFLRPAWISIRLIR